jgi:hypothetical protein
MTERYPPNYRRTQKTVNLMDVLAELGHTPESFARVVGRNASGLRRTIRGETRPTPSAARDIIEGLYSEGWRGDPNRIVQLQKSIPGAAMDRMRERTEGVPLQPMSTPRDASVFKALANLMQALGRKEVDRVYKSVFGTKPSEKDN